MFQGLRAYILSVKAVLQSPPLRVWFVSTMKRGAFMGVLVLILALVLGAWWISTLGDSAWFDVGAVVWVVGLLYFSGAIFGLVMSLGFSLLIQEQKLVRAISGETELIKSKVDLKDHWRELSSSLVSVFVSLIAWPFMLVPMISPLGVVMLAWAYSRESQATCRRIAKEYASHIALKEFDPGKAYLLGQGLLPSALSLIPFVAFFAWPTLLVSGLVRHPNRGKN